MRIYTYILSIFGLCLLMTSVPVFALSTNDCNGYTAVTPAGYAADALIQFEKNDRELFFFTQKDLETVFKNFRSYCCLELKNLDNCDEQVGPQYYPLSPFIGDHLITIGFRKLDGIEEHCKIIGQDCVNKQKVPDLAKERREKITEIAEDREGYPPVLLEKLFHKYRGDVDMNNKAYAALITKDWAGINTIRVQYTLLCEEIGYLQKYLNPITGTEADYVAATDGEGLTRYCQKMADERYKQEVQYVRTLMVEKGTQYLVQNLRAYSLDYFIDNRFSDLSDKYTAMEGCFNTVLSMSTNTACCNE